MADPVRRGAFARLLRALLWTAGLLGVLLAIDRGFFGTPEVVGWAQSGRLLDVPSGAGQLVFPAYLPQEISWPPSRIYHREKPSPGWWLGLRSVSSGQFVLWLGSGAQPFPSEFSRLESCLNDRVRCPAGWRVFSSQVDGEPVYLLTELPAVVATQILTELKREKR